MTKQAKPKCKHCGKSLVLIGRERRNGKGTYADWKTRLYHKKCYKLVKERRALHWRSQRVRNNDDKTV